jgi:hypothetical protein
VDVSPVSTYLDDLGAECRRRVEAASAESDLQKLAVLNQLLFSDPEPERYVDKQVDKQVAMLLLALSLWQLHWNRSPMLCLNGCSDCLCLMIARHQRLLKRLT